MKIFVVQNTIIERKMDMLTTPIIDRARQLRLSGFLKAMEEQETSKSYDDMSFQDRLGLLLEREILERENRALTIRIGRARFKEQACVEDLKASSSRGMDKSLLKQLSMCEWIGQKRNLLITGPSGAGKSYLGQALAHKACLQGYSARYFRATLLLSELEAARVDGRYRKLIAQLGRISVLVIDDFCLSPHTESEEKDLFELVEERHRHSSTIFTSQNPVGVWHGLMPNPAIADAILDRIVHGGIRIELKGESRRKESVGEQKDDILRE
jgi:DNA replication protein DnaC